MAYLYQPATRGRALVLAELGQDGMALLGRHAHAGPPELGAGPVLAVRAARAAEDDAAVQLHLVRVVAVRDFLRLHLIPVQGPGWGRGLVVVERVLLVRQGNLMRGAHGHDDVALVGGLVVGLDGLGVGLMAEHGHGRLGGLASGPGARKGVRALDHLAAAMFGGTQRGAQFGPQRTQNGGDVRRRAERGRGRDSES